MVVTVTGSCTCCPGEAASATRRSASARFGTCLIVSTMPVSFEPADGLLAFGEMDVTVESFVAVRVGAGVGAGGTFTTTCIGVGMRRGVGAGVGDGLTIGGGVLIAVCVFAQDKAPDPYKDLVRSGALTVGSAWSIPMCKPRLIKLLL